MNIAIININKNINDCDNNIIGFLSTILSDSLKAKEIIRILNEDFNIQATKNMKKEVDNMCDLSKGLIQKREKKFAFEMYKGNEPIEKIAKYSQIDIETAKKWVKEFSATVKKSCI